MTREEEMLEAARERADRHQIAERELNNYNSQLYFYDRIYNSEMASFEDGAKWSDKHPKCPWISVGERLPEAGEEVLLYNSHSVRHYEIGWLRKKKGDDKSKWAVSNGFVEDDDITHWMEIPKRPKEYEVKL